ncbi:TPA: melanoma antigen family A, 9-like [Bos taurus]|nr:TPA: melanoma antigen family A, 9-like [Bos taurus]
MTAPALAPGFLTHSSGQLCVRDESHFTDDRAAPLIASVACPDKQELWCAGQLLRTGEKRVSFACGSPLRIQSGRFHRGTFSDTQKQRAERWQWKGSYGGLQWRGADQGRVLQLGTSLVASTSPLSAAENQERYWCAGQLLRTGEKRVSFACGSPLRIQSGRFHRGAFSDTQKQKAERWQWKGSYGGLQWRGADQGRVLQLGTSLVASTSPLSAAENQERYWGSYGGLQWRGADQGRVLQLGTSLVAPTSLLSAAENQERYWPGGVLDEYTQGPTTSPEESWPFQRLLMCSPKTPENFSMDVFLPKGMGIGTVPEHHCDPMAQDPHLSPCLTPVCTSTLVIMQGMHELCQPERVFQDPRKEEGLMEAQFIWGEEKEVEEEVEEEENEEEQEKNELVQFLLSRCLAKEPITKAEVLNSVLKDYQDQVVFGQASEYLQLVFSLEVKEVDPSEHTYILVPSLGLTLSEMLSDGQRLPKAGLLVVILCLIAVEDGHAPEEEIWGALSRMGVCLGFLGDPWPENTTPVLRAQGGIPITLSSGAQTSCPFQRKAQREYRKKLPP